jgi:hypothetical protein
MNRMFQGFFKKSIAGLGKKHVGIFAAVAILVTAASFSSSAQIYVNVRPVAPVVVRTVAPSPRHVWIGEEWEVRDGAYVHTGGHWVEPPHPGWVWIPGHWAHDGRGHMWRPGHWRRR